MLVMSSDGRTSPQLAALMANDSGSPLVLPLLCRPRKWWNASSLRRTEISLFTTCLPDAAPTDMDPIAAKVWFAVERAYELGGELADARP